MTTPTSELRRTLDLYWEHGSDFGSQVAEAGEELLKALRKMADDWLAHGEAATERGGPEPDSIDQIEDAVMGDIYTECGAALTKLLDGD